MSTSDKAETLFGSQFNRQKVKIIENLWKVSGVWDAQADWGAPPRSVWSSQAQWSLGWPRSSRISTPEDTLGPGQSPEAPGDNSQTVRCDTFTHQRYLSLRTLFLAVGFPWALSPDRHAVKMLCWKDPYSVSRLTGYANVWITQSYLFLFLFYF